MKALTLTQPWASLVAIGAKRIGNALVVHFVSWAAGDSCSQRLSW